MKTRNLILLGVASFAVAALWKTPASFVTNVLPDDQLQATGLSGTIWNGQAQQVTINKTVLQNVSWSVKPLASLLSLSLKSNFTVDDPQIKANGIVGYGLGNTLSLSDTRFDTNGEFISRFIKLAKIKGDLLGQIKAFSLSKGELPEVEAVYQLQQGELIAPMRIQPTGDYKVAVSPQGTGLIANLSSNEAPLELSGNATIDEQWNWQTDIKIKPAAGANPGIMNVLKMAAGKLEADGSAVIRQKGQMTPVY